MAYENFENEDYRTADEALERIRGSLTDLEEQLAKMSAANEDAASGLRLDLGQSRREVVYMRNSMQRLQARFDNQLTVLVLGNIASGVGVAAIVLAASQGLQ